MKYLMLALFINSFVAMATQMDGFGANYYQDDSSISYQDTRKYLVPDVIIGDHAYAMEFSRLTEIAEATGVTVNHGDQASWLCLVTKGFNYWFISDNEMGQGDLTSIAIAKAEKLNSCSSYRGDVNVSVKGIPLLSASLENLTSIFEKRPDGNAVSYCTETGTYGDFIQMNCLQYLFANRNIKGVFISQITSN